MVNFGHHYNQRHFHHYHEHNHYHPTVPAEAVVAAGDDEAAVSVEMHGADRVGVGREGLEALARPHVPDADALVERAGHDQVGLSS